MHKKIVSEKTNLINGYSLNDIYNNPQFIAENYKAEIINNYLLPEINKFFNLEEVSMEDTRVLGNNILAMINLCPTKTTNPELRNSILSIIDTLLNEYITDPQTRGFVFYPIILKALDAEILNFFIAAFADKTIIVTSYETNNFYENDIDYCCLKFNLNANYLKAILQKHPLYKNTIDIRRELSAIINEDKNLTPDEKHTWRTAVINLDNFKNQNTYTAILQNNLTIEEINSFFKLMADPNFPKPFRFHLYNKLKHNLKNNNQSKLLEKLKDIWNVSKFDE